MQELNFNHQTSNEEFHFDHALKRFLGSRLNRSMQAFAERLSQHGFEVSIFSNKAIVAWSRMSEEQSDTLADQFQLWSNWIQMSEVEIERTPIKEKEIVFAQRALRHFGLSAGESFWKKYQEGQVIEIYGPEMIQLYRSMNFFKLCGYSLLDISVFQWYVLWTRPTIVIDQMLKSVEAVFLESHPARPANVIQHILLENMNTGDSLDFVPRAAEINFHHIGILNYEDATKQNDSFIVTSSSRIIAEGRETDQFRVI